MHVSLITHKCLDSKACTVIFIEASFVWAIPWIIHTLVKSRLGKKKCLILIWKNAVQQWGIIKHTYLNHPGYISEHRVQGQSLRKACTVWFSYILFKIRQNLRLIYLQNIQTTCTAQCQ